MARALSLAREALGGVSPNPAVGAVLVKEGRVVGEGHTHPPGQRHAETAALEQAGAHARGADLYVTLEPCAHYGRTSPCADALVEAGVAAVHAAIIDPDPRTVGKGAERLRAAGIAVSMGDGQEEAREIIEAFDKRVRTGWPFVTAKFAMSLDGKIAARTGDSRWISNDASRREAHRLRAESDAVMIGVGTALADDPMLTVRAVPPKNGRQPLRVVVDSAARLPPVAAMLRQPGRTIVATAAAPADKRAALEAQGAEVVNAPGADGLVDLPALLGLLGQQEVNSVLAEGGAALLGALLDGGLIDKVCAFVAPVLIGGSDAPSAMAGRGAGAIADALRLERVRATNLDGDMMVSGYPAPGA